MKFGRVLVTTALVAVLASSLFSGWISSALLPLKAPVALAADQTLNEICRGSSGITVNADWSTGVPVVARVTVSVGSTLSTNFTAYLYRSVASESKYGSPVTSATVNGTPNSVKLTDTPPAGQYHYFVLATQPSGGKDCSEESATYDPAGGSSGINAVKAQEWFGNKSLGTLNLRRFEEQSKPPYTIINGDRTVNRPKIRFQLTHIGAEGYGATIPVIIPIVGGSSSPIQWKNVDWLIFEAYDISAGDDEGGEKINDLYILANDNQAENVVFDKDRAGILKGKFTDLTHDFDISNSDLDKLFGYVYFHVPHKTDGWNCKDAGEAAYTVGPSGADKRHYSETGHSGDARFLNGNCIVPASGWPQYWGVSVNSVPYDASKSGCVDIGAILRDGIGPAVVKIFACVIQNIIDGIYAPLNEATQDAGNQIGVLESNLAGTGPNRGFVDAWKFSLGLINVVVILALLAIAFANILHLNINTYAAKKALPGLVIGVVGANASLLLIRFVLDVAKSLQLFAFDIAQVKTAGEFVAAFMNKIGMTAFENGAINFVAAAAFPLTFIVLLIFAIYMLFLTVVFAWGMLKRLVYIYGLTVLAPVAFVMYGVPGQQQWFTKWWDMMLRQIFMLPIVFIAAALLIRYVTVTVDPPNTTGSLDASNLINMVIIFLTATAILKLPGIITKGAIDITGAAKKAFGMAKQTPLRAVSSYQGAHQFLKGGGKERLSAGLYRKLGLKDQADSRANAAREKRLGYKKTYEKARKRMGWARGYAKLIDDPNILFESYQERVKQMQKDDKIAALTKTNRLPGKLRGAPAEALLQKGLAREEMKDANDKADYGDWNTGLGGGHLDAVYGKERNTTPAGVWKAILDAAGGNEEKAEVMRRRFGALGSEEAVLNFIEKGVNDGGLGINNQWDIADLMKAVGYESRITEGANRFRLAEGETKGLKPEAIMLMRRKMVDPDGIEGDRGFSNYTYTPPAGTGAAPSGGAAATDGAVPSGGSDSDIVDVRVTNAVKILNPENEALAGRLTQHANALAEKLGTETISKLAGQENVGNIITEEMRNTLQGELGSLFDNPDLVKVVLRAGAGGGPDVIRQHLMAGQAMNQANHSLSTQAAQISDEQLDQLGRTISSSNEEALKAVGGLITPHLTNISTASGTPPIDPKILQQYSQRIIDGFRQVMTQGPKSMRSYLQSNLSTLSSTFAKEQNIGHITPESIAKAISQTGSQRPTPQAPTPSVTTINNSEQSTVIEAAPSGPTVQPGSTPTSSDTDTPPVDGQ